MIKNYSIRRGILLAVGEIIIGALAVLVLLFGLSLVLNKTGQLTTSGNVKFTLETGGTVGKIKQEMTSYPYDYAVFENSNGKLLAGRYLLQDLPNFKEAYQTGKTVSQNNIDFVFTKNQYLTFVIRQNRLPEFTNHSLRSIPYNKFSYLVFSLGILIVLIFVITRLVRELSRGFQYIQDISLHMGSLTYNVVPNHSKIIEFEDILERLYAKSEELASLIVAERREKEDLSVQIAALSHDIKTPLTVLKGNIELLELAEMTAQQTEFLTSMKNSLATFDKYFNSMIDYTRLLNDENDYHEVIDLNKFISTLSVELDDLAKTYHVTYKTSLDAKVNTFFGNHLGLSRAITNIFVNACQYAKDGDKQIILSIREDNAFLDFEIWNNGRPFSDNALNNASKLFFTEDVGRSGKHYGIGLSFARGVALKHRGAIEFENPKDGGAKVIIKIKK
ncbi:MAG: sensor histidine kinase [Streptococcaceae bacterium]|jgi:signal transduction histidine kinase|nr:sensor histidine kinase [Streptococcaceae bacterium]